MTDQEQEMYDRELVILKQRWRGKADSIFSRRASNRTASGHLPLAWPMRVSSEYDFQYKYFYKGNFVDQSRDNPNNVDYNCGDRTYSNHTGVDISIWPFWWRMMDKNYVSAVAAAPGIIVQKIDTVDDRRCATGDTGSNRVWILHDGGTVTKYHHLKRNAVTQKNIGEFVNTGEFLGYVASSGSSSHPHLHFEVREDNNADPAIIEPFYLNSGCSNFSTESWWINQHPYWDSRINRVMTHGQMPSVADCETGENVYEKNNFEPGDQFYVGVAYSEFRPGDFAIDSIFKPDGNFFDADTIYMAPIFTGNYNNSYSAARFTLPAGNAGTWKIKVRYKGVNYFHFFTVSCIANLTPFSTHTGVKGYIAGSTISSTVNHSITTGDKVLYQAPASIEFKPGFYAPAGIVLKARLKPCNYAE